MNLTLVGQPKRLSHIWVFNGIRIRDLFDADAVLFPTELWSSGVTQVRREDTRQSVRLSSKCEIIS